MCVSRKNVFISYVDQKSTLILKEEPLFQHSNKLEYLKILVWNPYPSTDIMVRLHTISFIGVCELVTKAVNSMYGTECNGSIIGLHLYNHFIV